MINKNVVESHDMANRIIQKLQIIDLPYTNYIMAKKDDFIS